MKSEKKYLVSKTVFLCALITWIAFLAFYFLYVQKLPVEQLRAIVAYFDAHYSMLCAAAFLYAAMICFGLMLKYKGSRFMAFRFVLYVTAGCLLAGTLFNLLRSFTAA